jgi:diaminopimelate decarboxylase
MIRQLGERAPGSNVTLRINPGFGHGHSQKTNTGGEQSKHGIWHENLDGALQLADRYGVTVTGLHMHIGSGADFEHLSQVGQALEAVARKVGRTITPISAGGGLPTRYRSHDTQIDVERYFKIWDETRRRLQEEFGHAITLEIEPGRYLVAECGFLVAEIRAIKRMGNNLFYLLDAGFNSLARPILYGAYHPMSICPAKDGSEDRKTVPVVVGGPLCESGDIFTQQDGGFVCSRDLPVAEVGDFLVIEAAGAYGFVMASNYNSKPLPAEVAIYRGSHQVVRSRQTNEDLTRGERIPSWNG